jgi:lipoate-protein ligase A
MLGGSWRLVDTGPLDGARNMAIDEALLALFDPEASLPVLRLYGWNPPALSVGRFQDPREVLDLPRCRRAGVDVVPRITGGGVIYHADELTYTVVCAPRHIPRASSAEDTYRVLNRFLLAFYRGLGVRAGFAVDELTGTPEASRLGQRTAFCFSGCERYDVLAEGRKIGGNAQRRTQGAILQHGSIPLRDRAQTGIGFLREAPREPWHPLASLSALGVALPERELKEKLSGAFAGALGATFVPSALTDAERRKAASLADGRDLRACGGAGHPVVAATGSS